MRKGTATKREILVETEAVQCESKRTRYGEFEVSVKWNSLEHNGPAFAPKYQRLPSDVRFYYNGSPVRLCAAAEEVAFFYARMLDQDYTNKRVFNSNFMSDWRQVMTPSERNLIKDFCKCDFREMHAYVLEIREEKRAMSRQDRDRIKEDNKRLTDHYGFCKVDGRKEKVGNFRVEPPDLFRGRGDHPLMGRLKRRILPEDVIINCSRGKEPRPPAGHKWKEVICDRSVCWLACWTENIKGCVKYVMLNPSSRIRADKDREKFELAQELGEYIDDIREAYMCDLNSSNCMERQRAVAMYFIDQLALRAGNKKGDGEVNTVGCCSLRVEHVELIRHKGCAEYVVKLDFLGKDAIRYLKEVPVDKRVYANLQAFINGKSEEDLLFELLTTRSLNMYLREQMEGLTAKVFRTYNASVTLENELNRLTDPASSVEEKLLTYREANRAVATLCNHQRAVPKNHESSMAKLRENLAKKKQEVKNAERQYSRARSKARHGCDRDKLTSVRARNKLQRLREQLAKLERRTEEKEANKTVALGTSKLNYSDPRITVAWCKRFDVPIEKIYNRTQLEKFQWALVTDPDFEFQL